MFFSLFFIIILLVIGLLGYFGFMPGLSDMMGANKPKDLGVEYTKAEYDSFSNKCNGDITPITTSVDPLKSITYSGQISVNKDFTQEELSSRLNYSRWKYMPVSNVQLKINNDGSVEASGNVMMDRLPGFIAREGMGQYTMADVTKGLEFIKMIKINPPVYMKFNATVINNKVTSNISKIEVGKFNVPLDKVDANGAAVSVFNSIISKAPTFNAKSVTFVNGKMHFEGTIPAQMSVEIAK